MRCCLPCEAVRTTSGSPAGVLFIEGSQRSICGDVAKSMHFGGLCCDSCKAFFRRSVQSDGFRHFKCSGDNHCIISIASRKFCKLCRFNKCEKVGMVREWVMSEEERIQLMKSRLNKKSEGPEAEAGVDPSLVGSYKGRVALTASGAPNLHGLNRRRHMECRRRGVEDPDVTQVPLTDGDDAREPGEVDVSVYKSRILEPGEVDPSVFQTSKVLEPGQVDHTLYRKPRKKSANVMEISIDEDSGKSSGKSKDKFIKASSGDKSDVEPVEAKGPSVVKEKKSKRLRSANLSSLDKKKTEIPQHNFEEVKRQSPSELSSDVFTKSVEKSPDSYHSTALKSPVANINYNVSRDCGESNTMSLSHQDVAVSPSCETPTTWLSQSSDPETASSPVSPDCLDHYLQYTHSDHSLHSSIDYRSQSLAKQRHKSDQLTEERLRMSSVILEQNSYGKQNLTYKPDTNLGSAGNSLMNSPASTEGDSKTEFINSSLSDNSDILYYDDNSYDLSLNSFPRDPDKYTIMINERPGLPITNYMDNHELYKLKTVVRNMQKMEHHLPYTENASASVMGSYAQFIKRVTFFLDQFEEFTNWSVLEQSNAIKSNMTVIALVFGSSFLENRSGTYKNFLPTPTKKVTDMPAIEATLTPNIFRKFQEVIGILGQFQVDIRMGYMIILIIVLNPDTANFYKKLLYKYICWKYGQANASHINSHLFKAISGIKQHSCIFENMTAKTDRDDSYDEEGFSKRIKKEASEDDLQPPSSLLSDTIPYQMGDMPSSQGTGPNFDVLRNMFYSGASRDELRDYFWNGSSSKTNVKVEESTPPPNMSFTNNASPDIPIGGQHCVSGWPIGEPRSDPLYHPLSATPPASSPASTQSPVKRLKDMERSTFNPSNYLN
ncbi:Zinc finger nuclear hormone receptor-type [Trinorchestia longiramus]|nr:Zinc finger nuclear hormone receptor-type [Trinorchestia longiramus]